MIYFIINKINHIFINYIIYLVVTKQYLAGLGFTSRKGYTIAYDNRETYKVKDQYKFDSKVIPFDLSGDYDEVYDPFYSLKTKYSIKLSGKYNGKNTNRFMDYDVYLKYEKKMYDNIIKEKKYNTAYRGFEDKRNKYILEDNLDLWDYLLKYTDQLFGDINKSYTDETLARAFTLRMGNKDDDIYDEMEKKEYYFEDYYANIYLTKKEAELSLYKYSLKANFDNQLYNSKYTIDYYSGLNLFSEKKLNELFKKRLNVDNKKNNTSVIFSYFNFVGQGKYDGFFSMMCQRNIFKK